MTLLEELVKQGLLRQDQILEVVRISQEKYNGSVDRALADFKIDENTILEVKGAIFNFPVKKIDPKSVPPSVFKYIQAESAENYGFVPIGLVDDVLEIGIVDPENMAAMDALQFISSQINKPFKVFLISLSVYTTLVGMYQNIGNEVDQALSELDSAISNTNEDKGKEADLAKVKEDAKKGAEDKIVDDAPVIKIVAVILRHATEGNASDIHIENSGDKVKVRFRVDGVLHTSLVLPLDVYNGVVARIKILSKLRLDEKRKPQDGGFSAKIEGRKIDFRVSTMPSYYGEKIVMRILDPDKGVHTLDTIGMSAEHLAMVKEAIKRPYGLILMTGPTGSGKSTTVYSMLNELDSEQENIVSLEDPVEYHMPGINQSQVMPEIGYTFASGLRSILRQDPDIIMVGEIRDKETAQLAIQAALTGHLVFSTLHTNSAIGAIPRLVDMGIDPYLIAPTLIMTIAQRLTRKIHPSSKHEIPMDEATRELISKQFADLPAEHKSKLNIGTTMYESVSSAECPSGLSGRMPVFEMFMVDKEMQSVILKNPTENEIYKVARGHGMISMKEDAILKNLKGEVPFQEVYGL